MTEEQVFLAARDLPDPQARLIYLNRVCVSVEFRRKVDAMLVAHFQSLEFQDMPVSDQRPPAQTDGVTASFHAAPSTLGDDGSASVADDLPFLNPPSRPDSLGRLGHYEVLAVIGRGGFGIVLKAFDDVLHRIVAVKLLAPELAATSPARKRFLREARAAAAVRHENVVQIYAVEEQPFPYLVMEFIPGETLQDCINRTGPLEVAQVVRIGIQVANGLAAAHDTGLIHRDVKPANILLEAGICNRVRLTDFGLARAADDASQTQSGSMAGTPMYMAPEQANAEKLDHRTDLFSLGSVLYAMVTGRHPFRANSTMAVLKRVCDDHPRSISEIIPETPDWLCQVIAKLHAKNRDDRYQTAREVIAALALGQVLLLVAVEPATPKPVTLPRRRSRAVAIAALMLLAMTVATVGIVWQYTDRTYTTPSLRQVAETPSPVPDPPKTIPPVSPTRDLGLNANSFEEIHGATLAELQAWAAKLPKLFRPNHLSARGGSERVLFDAVAGYDPGGTIWELSSSATIAELETDWHTHMRNGFQSELICTTPDSRVCLFVKAFRPQIKWHGNAAFMLDRGAVERDLSCWPLSLQACGGYYELSLRPNAGGGRDSQFRFELTADQLVIQVEAARKRNWRLEFLSPNAAADRNTFTAVFCENRPAIEWEYIHKSTTSKLEAAVSENRKRGFRLQAIASQQEDGDVRYCTVWVKDTRPLAVTDNGRDALYRVLKSGGQLVYFQNGQRMVRSNPPYQPLDPGPLELLELFLSYPAFNNASVNALADIPHVLYRVEINGTNLTDAGLDKLLALPALRDVIIFDFNNSLLTDDGFRSIARLDNLSELRVRQTAIDGSGFGHLRGIRLGTLDCQQCEQFGDAALDHLADMTTLRELHLRGTSVTGRGLSKLARLVNLRSFTAGGPGIGDSFTITANNFKKLEYLHLTTSHITDVGMSRLAELDKLKILKIDGSGPGITDVGLMKLANRPALRELNVHGCGVTAEGVKTLAKSLPKCRIESDSGVIAPTEKD